MTRVLHVLDHSLPVHSGYSFRSESILQAQRDRGWQVSAVTSPKHEASLESSAPAIEEIGGVRYYRTGATKASRFPFVGERVLIDALTRRILQAAAVEKPQLLHAHSPVLTAIAALRAGKKLRIPVVYEIRAFWEDAAVDHRTYAEGSWKYRLTRAAETWACRRVSRVTVLCRGLEDDLAERGGIPRERVTVIGNGIDLERFAPAAPDEEYRNRWNLRGKRVAAFIGSFYRYEGLDLLIEAYARLKARFPDLVLLLVGGGEMERELQERARELGVSEGVVFLGRIPHDRVPGVYALADVLVYPRYSMRLTQLVTPLKPLEAMAMSKALLASDVGGHRELIQDGRTGVLFPAGDAAALAAALARLLEDPSLRRSLEESGRAWVAAERTWAKTTEPYGEIYARALEGNLLR
jgi:PEP-CTERM/exosortase A-associated glycosyltransferase